MKKFKNKRKNNDISRRLKLVRCIKHLDVGISSIKKSGQLKTIIQMEKHLKVNRISGKKGTLLIEGTTLTMNESSESALKMAGLTLSLVYKGFANTGKHKVFYEALFYITTILKATMLHYITAKESEQLVQNHKVATRNDFLFCVCSAIVYKLGVYVFPREGELLDVKVNNNKHIRGEAISQWDSVANGTSAAKLQQTPSMQEEFAKEEHFERMSTNKKVPKGSERINKKIQSQQFYSYIGSFITRNDELNVEYFMEYLTDKLNNNSKPRDIDEDALNFEIFRDKRTLDHLLPLIECVSQVCSKYGVLLVLKPAVDPVPNLSRLNFLNSKPVQALLGKKYITAALKNIALYFQNKLNN